MSEEQVVKLVNEAAAILAALGLPRRQQNERSAMCLLSLLDMRPGRTWADALSPLMGITPIIEWAREHLGKKWAPNSREGIRKSTIHHFVEAGLILYNPDEASRPDNSPLAAYQIEPLAV
ncbi:hypothetical protein RvVAT039_10470 [Agrobacterium vitis]|uniref:hypothetical protein n=1 Tax=Agrobacterium vitis TaxID=373 RepID=UPI0015DBE0A0|nr:hypothetical protein RvVAT039_10470 [Agrobacterium vitis]